MKPPISKTYNTDCMEGMKDYPDNHFDLAIVDPPYGFGDTWSKSRRDRFFKKGKLHQYQNEKIPSPEYFEELFRVSKNQIIWGGNYFTDHLPAVNGWIIWDKLRNADKTFMSEAELAWTSFKKVMRIAKFQWDGAKKCEKIEKIHPHQKPIMLYEWILMSYVQPGDKILDTHLGSGSSRIAAYKMGFDFVGFEIDAEYHKVQEERFKSVKMDLDTFRNFSKKTGVETIVKQESLFKD